MSKHNYVDIGAQAEAVQRLTALEEQARQVTGGAMACVDADWLRHTCHLLRYNLIAATAEIARLREDT